MVKKGTLLLDNTLETVLAVICVVLLFGGFLYLAYNALSNQESKNAQRTLNSITGTFERLDDGQQATLTLQGFRGAENWYLLAWNATTGPDKCFFENCLCICNGLDAAACQAGYCAAFDEDVPIRAYTNFSETFVVLGSAITYDHLSRNCIALQPNLQDITLFADSDIRSLSYSISRGEDISRYSLCDSLPDEFTTEIIGGSV